MRRFRSCVVVAKGGPTPRSGFECIASKSTEKRRDFAVPSSVYKPQRRISRSLPTSPSAPTNQQNNMATSQATAAAAAAVATGVVNPPSDPNDRKFGGGNSAVSTMNRSIKRAKAKSRMFLVYHPWVQLYNFEWTTLQHYNFKTLHRQH